MGARSASLLTVVLLSAAVAVFMAVCALFDAILRHHIHSSVPAALPELRRLPAVKRFVRRMTRLAPVRAVRERTVQHRRTEALRACIPQALRLLGVSLESGASLVQALRYAADNCSQPLADELSHTVWDLEAGRSFDEAMRSLRLRTGGCEFAYLAVAMEIQHSSGGSLTGVLESVATSLRRAAKLSEMLKTKTAQGLLSARIVTVMPIVLLVVLTLFSGDYLGRFFSNPLGTSLFALAIICELCGVLGVRKALSIDMSYKAVKKR